MIKWPGMVLSVVSITPQVFLQKQRNGTLVMDDHTGTGVLTHTHIADS